MKGFIDTRTYLLPVLATDKFPNSFLAVTSHATVFYQLRDLLKSDEATGRTNKGASKAQYRGEGHGEEILLVPHQCQNCWEDCRRYDDALSGR